jgi:hypothetical protein
MSNGNQTFSINDALGVADNLTTYSRVLEKIDPVLGAALARHLASVAAGQSVSTATIWDSLLAALAPAKTDQ